MPDMPWRTRHVATRVYRLGTVASTQDEARRLIERGDAHGALVIAEEQTQGRGRHARAWHSPCGNLYLSFVLQPALSVSEWTQFTMMAALAVRESVAVICTRPARLKWPNDVLIGERKVAGILSEIVGTYLSIGVGLNVNAPLPSTLDQATTLRGEVGHALDTGELLRDLVERMDAYYAQLLTGARFTRAWSAQLSTLGRAVRVQMAGQSIEGLAERVDEAGALLVRRPDGSLFVCHAGEVTLRA